MNTVESVFNCHINNAQEKAIGAFRKKYGREVFLKEIDPLIKRGIMSVFNQEPNEHTLFFVKRIEFYVNQSV
jgi:hypothetical protein